MISSIADRILGLHGWAAAAVVFALPALEASAFVGFIFPGEIAILLGGVLAYQHQLSLPGALAAAIAGALIGDTVGYEIGKRHGRRLLHGTVGRFVRHEHLDRAERYLAERGGKAVFVGRFTAALRVLIPGLAGMSGLRYRTFLAYNAAGGVLWATTFVLAGYAAGSSWRRVEHAAGRASLVLLLLVIVIGSITLGAKWASRHRGELAAFADRLRDRYQRQLAFAGRRLRPGGRRGLSLTVGLALLVATGWIFGALSQDVIAGDEAARLDQPVLTWFVRHREPWLTHLMTLATALGSTPVVLPVATLIGIMLWRRTHSRRPLAFLAATYVGAELLFQAVKRLTDRARPDSAVAVHHFGGRAFPSGHATLATAMWGAIAILVAPLLRSWRHRVAVYATAAVIAAVVGITRLYLGAHWLSDVLAGWALGAAWLEMTTIVVRPTTSKQ